MENRNNSKINTAMTIACVHTMQQKPIKQTAPKIVFKGSDVQTNGCICMECSESMRMPKTYIMRWNPEISSHKLVDFEYGMKNFFDHDFYYDWSIWDYNDVEIEKHHSHRFELLAEELKAETVFKKEEVTQWICRKCGHIHIGKEAPCKCPVCEHPQAYFQVFVEKY